jgi:hypothetical protein
LIDVVEIDLALLAFISGQTLDTGSQLSARREQLCAERVSASLDLWDTRATWTHARVSIVKKKVAQAVRDREALLWARDVPRIENRGPFATTRDELVDLRWQGETRNEDFWKAGLDDFCRRERRLRLSCATSKFRSNLDQGR